MYDYKEKQILLPHEFFLPFGGKLDENDEWCELALIIPWIEIEEKYADNFKNKKTGNPAFSVRMALGSLIIQSMTGLSDRGLVKEIKQNVYMQYFIGLREFTTQEPFDPSSLVHFRKRFDPETLIEINEMIAKNKKETKKPDDKDDNDSTPKQEGKNEEENIEAQVDDYVQGTLILDATCTPADIKFPTDLGLLNEVRESFEEIIDTLHQPLVGKEQKPRTYRQQARKDYLNVDKKKKKTSKEIRKGIKKQLGYIRRNIEIIEKQVAATGMELLSKRQLKYLYVGREIYRQQLLMYKSRKHQVEDRIVSLHMPFVRPIVRGKANANVEFGAKLAVSIVDGYVFPEVISFDSFNEGKTLIESAENYKRKYGYYPQEILADKIYRNRENIQFCKLHHIRFSGPPLGRPAKDPEVRRKQYRQEKEDTGMRNAVEGKFGEGKRSYGLARIMAHLEDTSKSVIVLQLLAMNLKKRLRSLLCLIWKLTFKPQISHNYDVFMRVA